MKTILYVEDTSANFTLVLHTLKRIVNVDRAVNGKECLRYLQNNELPPLILLDVRLPDVNGFELLAEIKETYPTVPVYLFSAHAQVKDIEEQLEAGLCEGYITKPPNLMELRNIVSRYV